MSHSYDTYTRWKKPGTEPLVLDGIHADSYGLMDMFSKLHYEYYVNMPYDGASFVARYAQAVRHRLEYRFRFESVEVLL